MAIFEQIIHLSDHIATHVVVGFSCSTNSISLPWMYHYNVFAVAVVKVVSKCVNDNWCRTWYCCVRLLLLLLLLFLTLMLLSRAPSLTTAAVEHFKLFFYSISILSLSISSLTVFQNYSHSSSPSHRTGFLPFPFRSLLPYKVRSRFHAAESATPKDSISRAYNQYESKPCRCRCRHHRSAFFYFFFWLCDSWTNQVCILSLSLSLSLSLTLFLLWDQGCKTSSCPSRRLDFGALLFCLFKEYCMQRFLPNF